MDKPALPEIESSTRLNHLAGQKSLYLRQHSENPVDWYPWSPEAHNEAERLQKPILLSIGYSSCHWCHVMEKEVFSQEDTARVLKENFISIKVDREEMPEIDHFYMTAAQAMGLGGGWPLNVFLTPDRKPFYAVTYLPRPAFMQLVHHLAGLWQNDRRRIESLANRVVRAIEGRDRPSPSGEDRPSPGKNLFPPGAKLLAAGWLEKLVEQESEVFDEQWGGVLGQAKFPTPARWHFLLHLFRRTGDQRALRMLTSTLDAMASGGLHDQLGGGFHRYTVDREWLIPHFEKMLYDNALLADLYLEAGLALDRPDYLAVARSTLDFITQKMGDRPGLSVPGEAGFAASLDADSPDGEGAYYCWTVEQLEAVAGVDVGKTLARILGVEARPGPVSSGWVPMVRALSSPADRELLDHWRPHLLAARERRPRPALDTKVVTAWNAMAIRVLARAALATGENRYLEAASSAMRYLERVHLSGDRLARASNDGQPAGRAVLEDYAWMAAASLALFQASGDLAQAERALRLARQALELFGRSDGQFTMAERDAAVPVSDLMPTSADLPTPSGGAVMAHVMLELYELTADSRWLQRTAESLVAITALLQRGGLDLAWWQDAALLQQTGQVLVVLAGEGEARTRAARQLAHRLPPQLVLAPVQAAGLPAARVESFPPLAEKAASDEQPRFFLCSGVTCRAPSSNISQVLQALQTGWQH